MTDTADNVKSLQDLITAYRSTQALPLGVTLIPDGYTLASTEEYADHRQRTRGRFETSLVEDFANYFARNTKADKLTQSPIFIDQAFMHAVAALDWLVGDDKPGHLQHTALCQPIPSPEWKALCQLNRTQVSQDTLVDFLEDLAPIVTAFDETGQGMPASQLIAAFRNAKITKQSEHAQTLDDSVVSRSALETIDANASKKTPHRLIFHVIPYAGFQSRSVNVRVVIRATPNNQPLFALHIVSFEALQYDIAAEFVNLVQRAIDDMFDINGGETPAIYVGRFQER